MPSSNRNRAEQEMDEYVPVFSRTGYFMIKGICGEDIGRLSPRAEV